MPYEIIKTGSKGNCIILNNNILLDVGIPFKTLKKYLKNIDLIFISHIHSDHLLPTCVKQINYNFPTIKFICNLEVASKLNDLGVRDENIWCLRENKWYDLGFAIVKLSELVHDAHNSSFQIEYKNGGKALYITDTKEIPNTINAKNYDLYLIENNYNEDILQKHLEIANDDEKIYLNRTMNTHLSKSACDDFLLKNMGDNSKFEYIHLSKYNNTDNGL